MVALVVSSADNRHGNAAMLESDDELNWEGLNLENCPECGSPKVVPAVPGWIEERYCLNCKQVVGPSADTPVVD